MNSVTAHMNSIREFELQQVMHLFPPGCRILEIGAGSGYQASKLKDQGFQLEAIDVNIDPTRKFFEVRKYDGKKIPFPDHSFDIVFSSNALEHIEGLDEFQEEIKRVLKPNGTGVHVLPTATWRFWSWISHCANWVKIIYKLIIGFGKAENSSENNPEIVLKTKKALSQKNLLELFFDKLLIPPHGVKGNALTEIFYFNLFHWISFFKRTGWQVNSFFPNRLFYTDYLIFGVHLNVKSRHLLSYALGSSCIIYVLKK
jgi:ubiquinone/menaquinone biosynthesis C-methylase UbiE